MRRVAVLALLCSLCGAAAATAAPGCTFAAALVAASFATADAFAPAARRRPTATSAYEPATALFAKKKKGQEPPKPVRERKVQEGKIEVDGVVLEALPSANFRVEIGVTKQVLLCTISGKIRKNFVKILVGDSVKVELSPYDLTRGRITFRERGK
mmetsp:Transcript_15686/g.47087  ORF Transcript_15686/g.47087 Transcript_15686/m.47087 type:complete len:155 (+) Transcript_15686:342-806(+)